MSYIAEEEMEERLNRYQRLKKEARNSVDRAAKIRSEMITLHGDSANQTEKDEVLAMNDQYVDQMKAALGIVVTG